MIPTTRAWHCIELELDGGSHTVRYFLDGQEIEKLHLTEEDRVKLGSLHPMWSPLYKDFRFGWQAYGTIPATIFYDDVIISTERIPCAPWPGVENDSSRCLRAWGYHFTPPAPLTKVRGEGTAR